MSASSSRPRPPPPGFLSRIPVSELKLLRVAVKRGNFTTSGPCLPIERSIDDPKQLIPLIHLRKANKDEMRKQKNLFDREDVLVNQEERVVLADANALETEQPGTSKSFSRSKSRSPRTNRSASSSYRKRSRSNSHSRRSKDKDWRTVSDKESAKRKSTDRETGRRSADKRHLSRQRSLENDNGRKEHERDLERDKRYRGRPYSREREEEKSRRRSRTPLRPGEYRPSHSDLRRRSVSRDRDKYRRTRSPSRDRPFRKSQSPKYSKPSTSRKSRSPKRSITPQRAQDRPRSPRYHERQRSKSPGYGEKKRRERSPGYKGTDKGRRSRSPSRHERKRSRSPTKHSEAGKSRGSPSRYDRYSRRHSRSPGRHDKKSRASRSPRPPVVSFSRSRTDRRRSRTPGYERHRYHKRRSRSSSPRKHRSRSPRGDQEDEFAYYEGIPGSEYWIPGPMRAGFPVPRFYPPAFYPRMPGGPIILPPRMPYPPYRQRLPIYNSKPPSKAVQQLPVAENQSAASGGESRTAADPGSSKEDRVAIQELTGSQVTDDSDKKNPEEESRDSLHEKD